MDKTSEHSKWKTGLAGFLGNFAILVFHPLEAAKVWLQGNFLLFK